ncbi:MAG TPA: hypothetical protein VHQ02_16190 [Usitatibacter sp.]|jgi:hypothetical protein|nr:hypothetical protein [Usitatibacter sp.]
MKTTMRWILAATALAAAPVLAAGPNACARDPAAKGLPARVENMHQQMDRIHWATDPEEQRRLIDLHAKLMHESLQELGKRQTTLPCRLEMMNAMMDQMIQHQQVDREGAGD